MGLHPTEVVLCCRETNIIVHPINIINAPNWVSKLDLQKMASMLLRCPCQFIPRLLQAKLYSIFANTYSRKDRSPLWITTQYHYALMLSTIITIEEAKVTKFGCSSYDLQAL